MRISDWSSDVCSSDLDVQPGKMVFELRPRGIDKGSALTAFMREAPYAGRVPVMVGDDLTDEAGFIAARHAGGYGIKFGAGRSPAMWRLAGRPARPRGGKGGVVTCGAGGAPNSK